MQTIYMLSGFDINTGFYQEQEKYLKNEIKNSHSIAFVVSDFIDNAKTDRHVNIIINSFNKIGISFNSVKIIDYRIDKNEAKEYIEKSDILFIMGGDTYNEFQYIKEYNLIKLIKNFNGIIIGVSAGSLNMSKNVCYLDEYKEYNLVQYEGLGLTNINIYPHFDINNKEFVKETLEVSKHKKIYALPNESFIIIKDNKYDIVGVYYIFENNDYVKGDL